MKKSVFLLLATAPLAFGQATVVKPFDEDQNEGLLSPIGIIPTEDYQKATAEVKRLQSELDVLQKKSEQRKEVAGVVAKQRKQVQALRNQLQEAEQGDKLKKMEHEFARREKALVKTVNLMERERAQMTQRLKSEMTLMQEEFTLTQNAWGEKLQTVEQERDLAVEQNLAYQLEWEAARQAWEKSVERWDEEVANAIRSAQIAEAKKAVANTARLAADWQAERENLMAEVEKSELKRTKGTAEVKKAAAKTARLAADWKAEREQLMAKVAESEQMRTNEDAEVKKAVADTEKLAADWQSERENLMAEVAESEQMRAKDNEAWKASVEDWRQRAAAAVRTSNVKNAQAAVANTAQLAKDWQNERNQLEAQVDEMSANLAKLEGQLGVRGFEKKQAEVLRLGLTTKSRALEDLGTDAARLAVSWRNEREESRRELDAMRDLYKSTARDVKTRDQRVKQLDNALAQKNKALDELAIEAGKLSESWTQQRGGLQQKIANLEKQLKQYQTRLQAAVKKEKDAQSRLKDMNKEKQGFLSQVKKDQENDRLLSTKLATQLKTAGDLQEQLSMAKLQEGELKSNFGKLRREVDQLKSSVNDYRSQKEADAEALAALQAELEEERSKHAATERQLVLATETVKKSQAKENQLKQRAQSLEAELAAARKELATARKAAQANQNLEKDAMAKAKQVENLEDQLGRLAVAQQELEGTLISTLGDFEKLQKSYIELKAKSAGGGDSAREAVAAKVAAEQALSEVQQQLKTEEEKLQQARKRVQQAEEKNKAVEADAKAKEEAGKVALGKREAELKEARREVNGLQQGQKALMKEKEELRKRFVQIQPVRYQLASANVVAQQQRVLAEVRQVLDVYPDAKFNIKGYTCNLGSEEGNLKLSAERALLLRDFLLENGLEESRFSLVEGCGITNPQASNDTDEGRRQNRRVEIEVVQ